ncbi:hypothetical protein [Paraburkholderia sp. J7]|uniref:hypothetical protein n=1 Tax=Paraburkholderia sp. J7 TaxID=2805438 RepID=UPI002AB71EB8|nr:hypothetical protein [Paraburkholderia sp. J7]
MKIRRFTFKPNEKSVTRISSRRMTVYIPDEVPVEVIQLWLARLTLPMKGRLSTLRRVRKRETRRKRVPVCRLKRRRIRHKRIHVPVRFWRHAAAR